MKSNKKFEKINIGSSQRVSNIEIAKIVFKIMKQNNLTKLNKSNFLKTVKDRPGHDKRYALNTSFFKKTISCRMKFNLSLGLKNTIDWYIKNIKWLKSTKKSYNFKRLGLL
jgi:dTDP-glucose 4,6-dehydratase